MWFVAILAQRLGVRRVVGVAAGARDGAVSAVRWMAGGTRIGDRPLVDLRVARGLGVTARAWARPSGIVWRMAGVARLVFRRRKWALIAVAAVAPRNFGFPESMWPMTTGAFAVAIAKRAVCIRLRPGFPKLAGQRAELDVRGAAQFGMTARAFGIGCGSILVDAVTVEASTLTRVNCALLGMAGFARLDDEGWRGMGSVAIAAVFVAVSAHGRMGPLRSIVAAHARGRAHRAVAEAVTILTRRNWNLSRETEIEMNRRLHAGMA